MNIDLGYRPREWQITCHRLLRRFSVLALHRRAGKTELAIMQLLDRALRFQLDMGLFFYVAPELKQAKLVAWIRLKARVEPLRRAGLAVISESELSVTLVNNGAVIRIFGADNPDAMRGVRLDGAVLDEVAQMKPEVWFDIIRAALADREGWALFIGTPKGINLFSKLFFGVKEDPEWMAAKYTCFQTNALSVKEIESMRRGMSEETFRREMLCDFDASGDNQLISLADAQAAAGRLLRADDSLIINAPRILGVDPARFGSDRSVLFPRQGQMALRPVAYQGIDNMRMADKVARKIDDWEPDAVFIDEGQGQGVIDRLTQLNYEVIGIHFGGKAAEGKRFINKRTEMWYGLKEWVEAGGAIPDLEILKEEIATPNYTYDSNDRIVLESKDDIKKRLQHSPDLADALALTFAMPVQKRSLAHRHSMQQYAPNEQYDPYANLMRR